MRHMCIRLRAIFLPVTSGAFVVPCRPGTWGALSWPNKGLSPSKPSVANNTPNNAKTTLFRKIRLPLATFASMRMFSLALTEPITSISPPGRIPVGRRSIGAKASCGQEKLALVLKPGGEQSYLLAFPPAAACFVPARYVPERPGQAKNAD